MEEIQFGPAHGVQSSFDVFDGVKVAARVEEQSS